jgi:glycosyltransferase involved in cell wall biosynthesis
MPSVVEVLAELRRLGVSVVLVTQRTPPGAEPGAAERAEAAGVPCVRVEGRRGWFAWRARHRVDVVHVHQSRDHAWAWMARGAARLVRSNWSGLPLRARRGEIVLCGRMCDGYVSYTRRGWESDVRAAPRLRARSLWIPPPLALDRFARGGDRNAGRERLGVPPDAFLAGAVMRVQPHRRVDVLLRAMALLARRNADAMLAVVGRGTRIEELAVRPAREMGLGRRVVFPGHVREGYEDVLAAFDVFVYLAPGSDGTCRALREAMAAGLCCAGARHGMIPELLEDGACGVVFERDAAALACALDALGRDPARRNALAAAARAKALRDFDARAHAARLREWYASLFERVA